ncbi:MAG: hypothetical protein MJ071_02075 [Oscillospiraceae bacterium]|nr:hypothetical protein [Oscillospiraceae bacterium]
MNQLFSDFTEKISDFQQKAHFLSEIFFAVVSCFWFMSNIPVADAYDTRLQKCILFLVYLTVCVLLKWYLSGFVLTEYGIGHLSGSYISFFLSMIELGCFFDFYIVGYSEQRSIAEIALYAGYWYIPIGMILAAALAAQRIRKNSGHGLFRRKKKSRGKRPAAKRAAASEQAKQDVPGKAWHFLCSQRALWLILFAYAILGALCFLMFRNTSSSDLQKLNARNKVGEAIKLILFFLLALFASARKKHHEGGHGITDMTWKWLSFLACAVTAGVYLLSGEFGSAIIMAVFACLLLIYFFSERWGMVAVVAVISLYLTGFAADRIFRSDGYPLWIVNGIGMERWNRLYHLEAFPQVLEMRTVLRKSEWLRGLIPYNVSMTGKIYTRIEDFSYLNLVSVFGSLVAFVVMGYYVLLLMRVFYRLNDTLRKNHGEMNCVQQNLFLLAQFMCLYIVAHALIHVISNLTFLFFTGVPLPFISKGISNLAVVLVCSAVIVYCLQWEERYAKRTKQAIRKARAARKA